MPSEFKSVRGTLAFHKANRHRETVTNKVAGGRAFALKIVYWGLGISSRVIPYAYQMEKSPERRSPSTGS